MSLKLSAKEKKNPQEVAFILNHKITIDFAKLKANSDIRNQNLISKLLKL